MRKLEMSPSEYNNFVWPAVNGIASKDFEEAEQQAAVNRKLKSVGCAKDLSAEQRRREMEGLTIYPDYEAQGPVEILLEEAEHRFLTERLKKFLPAVTGYATEDFLALFARVKDAPKVELAALKASV